MIRVAPLANYPDTKYEPVKSVASAFNNGYAEVKFKITPGNYFVRVESSHCAATAQLGFLPGHERSASLALIDRCSGCIEDARLYPSIAVLMGTIPMQSRAAFLVSANGSKRQLDVQRGAYYIERVVPGTYWLRFEIYNASQSEIHIEIPNIPHDGIIRHDIDEKTFRKNLGAIAPDGHTLKNCDWCYP